jgi:hypothetical protein
MDHEHFDAPGPPGSIFGHRSFHLLGMEKINDPPLEAAW